MEEILQPIYRIEDYWYAIANGLSCPHTPIYRIEQYLAFLCGADVEVPQPIYRIEQYLAYKCGLDVELPQPIYRQEMFLAKWCGMDVEPPTPIYRIEVLLSQLSNGYLHTETGNPISVSDALAKPAESLTIEILPQQSGSGDPSPDNVRPISGWSNVNVYREAQYDAGATPYATINLNGTVYGGTLDVTNGVLTVDRVADTLTKDSTWYGFTTGSGNSSAVVQLSMYQNCKYVDGSASYNGSISSTGAESPNYWVGARQNEVPAQGDMCFAYSSTGQLRFHRLDVASIIDLESFKSAFPETTICYYLATPQTIQLTPTEIEMLLGNNVIWNDVGDMVLEYLADGPADDIDALQILLNNRYVNNGEPDEATDKEALEILLGGNTR